MDIKLIPIIEKAMDDELMGIFFYEELLLEMPKFYTSRYKTLIQKILNEEYEHFDILWNIRKELYKSSRQYR